MNLLEVGALLQRERERRGISIRDVMDSTKISRRNLTALEEGQVGSLPHPVYLKGYVRNIAKMVGLDADELAQVVDQQFDAEAAKYLRQAAPAALPAPTPASAPPVPAPPASEIPVPPAPRPVPPAPLPAQPQAPAPGREARPAPEPLVPPKPKPGGSLRSVLALVLLLVALGVMLVQYQRLHNETPPAPVPAAPMADNATNATDQDNASAALDMDNASVADTAEPIGAGPSGGLPAAPSVSQTVSPAASPQVGKPASPAAAQPSRLSAPEPPRTQAPATPSMSGTSIEVSRRAPAAAQDAPARAPGVQTLTITAKANEICWVGVYEGAKGTSFTLRGGESRQVEFTKRASLRLGNAGGVTVRLNGQDYPFEGERGQKLSLEFGSR